MRDREEGFSGLDENTRWGSREGRKGGLRASLRGTAEDEGEREPQRDERRPHTSVPRALGAALLLLVGCASPSVPPERAPDPEPSAPELEAPAPPLACLSIERVEIRKAERRLTAYCARGATFVTTVAIGREPHGPKRVSGDLRTPEGTYHVVGPIAASRFHGFIPLDYPSLEDADRALDEHRISRADHRRIAAAHREGRAPPTDTPLGGDIGIHGEGTRWRGLSSELDWTLGCLAVEDAALGFLAERMALGTPVVILP